MLRAVTSASNIFRRRLCPGSERLEAGLPDEDSPQSREGTILHQYDANQDLDRAVLKPQQRDLLCISAELDDFVFARAAEQFGITPDDKFIEGREQELLALVGGDFETPGHCDRWRIYSEKRVFVVIDKKFGYREVTPAAANYQLRTYALGAYEQLILAELDTYHVVVAITQPRLPFEQRVTMAAYNVDDLHAAEDEVAAIRRASAKPDAPLVAGEEQCRYCKAKLVCPAFQTVVAGVSPASLKISANGSVAKRKADFEEIVSRLNADQRDSLITAVKFADYIKEQLYDCERSIIAGGGESRYTVGKPQEMRKIADVKRAVALLTLRGDLDRDAVLDCCSMKIGDDGGLTEALRRKKNCTWKQAKEILETTLAPVIEREAKKPSLTRIKI